MFEIEYDDLIFLFTALGICTLALVFLAQLVWRIIRHFRNKKLKVRCRLCNYHFLNTNRQKYIACPNCRGLNEPGHDKRL